MAEDSEGRWVGPSWERMSKANNDFAAHMYRALDAAELWMLCLPPPDVRNNETFKRDYKLVCDALKRAKTEARQ